MLSIMRLQWIAAASVLLLVGCQAHMMETYGDKIQLLHAPNEKPGKGGVIRYLNTGLPSWRTARRHDAMMQMQQFCGGRYTITDEGPRSKFGSSMPIGDKVSVEVDQYWYIAFTCPS